MNALLGKDKTGREHLVEQATSLSLRIGNWKYIEPNRGAKISAYTNVEMGHDPNGQLYNLASDLGETHNVAAQHPDKVKAMSERLQKIRQDGRSR
jgi:arylsulfatase A-like enzyme